MNRTMSTMVGVAIVIMIWGGFGTPFPAAAQPVQAVPVVFQQLNWLGADGNVQIQCSQVGVAQFVLRASNSQLLEANGGGYIQVMTRTPSQNLPTWSVRNLYLSYPSTGHMKRSHPTVQFQLQVTSGICLQRIRYVAVITSQPLLSFRQPTSSTALVTSKEYLVGGRNGGSGLSTIPLTVGPWVGHQPSAHVVNTARTSDPGQDLAEIDEDIDGCAPAAAARSIKYLMDNAGISTDDAQDIYEDLVEEMETELGGGGTSDPDMIYGKRKYTRDKRLPIESKLKDWDDVTDVSDRLNGCDVEILISWEGGGGHAAMVASITPLDNGQYQITYVDDPTQGDGVAENQEHTILVHPDGSFADGTVDGFMVECVVP